MTLIPLISALAAAPERAPAPVGTPAIPAPGTRYDPGAGHRPLAALFAFGVPAALVVAVALSPMIIERTPTSAPVPWKSFTLPPAPPPEPQPQPPQAEPRPSATTTTVSPLPPVAADPPSVPPAPPLTPPSGSGAGVAVAVDPPVPPRPALVAAAVDPRFAGTFQPDYPAREQRAGIEGVVRVRVLIGTDGRVKAVELVSTDDPAFFEATRKRALSKWRFKPATRGGVPEESWKEMTVRFQIRDA